MTDLNKFLGKTVNDELNELNKKEVEGLSGEESFLANLEAEQATRICDECQTVGGHSNNCVKCE